MSIAERSTRTTWYGPLAGSGTTLEAVDGRPTITTSRIQVHVQVPGVDDGTFAGIVDEASALGPVSRLFAGAEITVDARLDES